MKTATIRDLRDKQPFQPFSIHIADGRNILVATPDHIFISPSNDELVVYSPEGHLQIFDAALDTGARRKQRPRAKGRILNVPPCSVGWSAGVPPARMEPDAAPPRRRGESANLSRRPAGGTPALQGRYSQDAPRAKVP